jgi:hypothetical protein
MEVGKSAHLPLLRICIASPILAPKQVGFVAIDSLIVTIKRHFREKTLQMKKNPLRIIF